MKYLSKGNHFKAIPIQTRLKETAVFIQEMMSSDTIQRLVGTEKQAEFLVHVRIFPHVQHVAVVWVLIGSKH
jgi:hypothetical protein